MQLSKNGKLKNLINKLSGYYTDADEYARNISQANLEHHILEPGQFNGELIEVISEEVMVSTHKMNQSLLQIGTSLKGYTTFILPGNMSQDFSWRSQRLSGKRIGLLRSNMKHFTVLPTNFFATLISLSNRYFCDLIIKLKYDVNLIKVIQQREMIEIDHEDAYKIQQIVIELCNSEHIDSDLLTDELPVLLFKAIENVKDTLQNSITSRPKDMNFGRAIDFIDKNLKQKLNSEIVCSACGISERNLRYLFQEMIGLSPMRYIKCLRLNKIRKEILNNNNEFDIGLIVTNWGINHYGYFAADYKKLFGVLPSDTLKQIRKK